jgi:two-component system chemotaxis response regulator CheY
MNKVLIVDDIEDNRFILKRILKKIGNIDTYEALDGAQAVEMTKIHKPDIVLMDLMMPVMDGYEATKQVKALHPECRVIVVTAVQDIQSEEKLLEAGAIAYIRKPIDLDITRFKLASYLNIASGEIDINKQDIVNFVITDSKSIARFGFWVISAYFKHFELESIKFSEELEVFYDLLSSRLKDDAISFKASDNRGELLIKFNNHINFTTIELSKFKDFIYFNILNNNDVAIKLKSVKDLVVNSNDSQSNLEDFDTIISNKSTTKLSLDLKEKEFLRKDHKINEMSAIDYVQSLEESLITELEFDGSDNIYLRAIGDSIYRLELTFNDTQIVDVSRTIHEFSVKLLYLSEFNGLGNGLGRLSEFLEKLDLDSIDDGLQEFLIDILYNIHTDLTTWVDNIFIAQTAANIHFLDSSLLSSCLQIEMSFGDCSMDIEDDDDDIEFF